MDYFYSDEAGLSERLTTDIAPFWQQHARIGEFQGVDGVTIVHAHVLHPNPIGSIVISAGRVESLVKYQELIFELYQNGYSVFIHDHRGQGLSGRMHSDPQRGYVADFDHYVQDMATFYETVVAQHSQTQPILLAHSMGCAIGALYLLQYPQHFCKAVFSAPMFGIKSPLPPWLATSVIHAGITLNELVSRKPWYFLSQTPYIDVPFAINTLSHSKLRYSHFRQQYQQQPSLQLGGVTYQWLDAAVEAMEHIEQHASEILTPLLVLQAGGDHVVDNKAQSHVCALLPHCDKRVIKDARHELMMESDEYRQPALALTYEFMRLPEHPAQ